MTTEEKVYVKTDMLEIDESDELEHNLQYLSVCSLVMFYFM